jgi:hypothetical protein
MTLKERLLGPWRLVSFEYHLASGGVLSAYGPEPVGLLIYTDEGYMSAQIVDPRRPRFASGNRRIATEHELKAAVEGCISYFAAFEIDEARGAVVHRELGDVFPNAVGTRQVRYARFEGDRLLLETPPVMVGTERATARIVWERAGRLS